MAFEAKEYTVDKLLNDAIYYIPRNQRKYVWKQENWEDMYDDILLVADHTASSHFIGSIVLKDEGKKDGLARYTVIDGQQRILTLTIFLISIMFIMKKRNLMDDFGGTQKYLVAKNIKNQYCEIVYPEAHLSLTKMVNQVVHGDRENIEKMSISTFANRCTVSSKDKQIISAFKYYAEKLNTLETKTILSIRDAVIGIGYVHIISSIEEDLYTIFEILNARGLALDDHELLKNYIMRYLQPEERRDDAKQIWQEIESDLGENIRDFLRHYAIQKFNYGKDKKISVYKAIQNATKGRGIDKLLDDIKIKSNYYKFILNPSSREEDQCEFEVFTFFKHYRVKQFRPLILSLMHQYKEGNISQDKYHTTLKFLYTFFICYKIIGEENSNKLSDTVYKYAYLIENNFSDEELEKCISSFKEKLPTLKSFTNSFKNIGFSRKWEIYNDSKAKERCKLVLALIEKYISNRDINIDVTIEHILPDCDCIENAQIGNLLFLESNLNKQCATKSLEEKIEIYQKSMLQGPRNFAQRYRNKQFIPSERTNFLAKVIYNNILDIL